MGMIGIGQYFVYLTGSHKKIVRAIYKDENGRLFCKWHGNMIEVARGTNDYYTIERY